MSIPGGIRVKLALALLGIVGGALFAAYVIVVPSLERRLVEAKLDQQQSDAEALAVNYAAFEAQNILRLADFVDSAGFVANSRVVVFSVAGPPSCDAAGAARRFLRCRRRRDRAGFDCAWRCEGGPDRASAGSAPGA